MNTGWICPRCGKVNAPHVAQCDCVGGGKSLPCPQPYYPPYDPYPTVRPYPPQWWEWYVTC